MRFDRCYDTNDGDGRTQDVWQWLLHIAESTFPTACGLSSFADGKPRRVRLPSRPRWPTRLRRGGAFGTLCDFCNALHFFESHRNPALISIAMSLNHNNGGAS
jgi:hypothetical protein